MLNYELDGPYDGDSTLVAYCAEEWSRKKADNFYDAFLGLIKDPNIAREMAEGIAVSVYESGYECSFLDIQELDDVDALCFIHKYMEPINHYQKDIISEYRKYCLPDFD